MFQRLEGHVGFETNHHISFSINADDAVANSDETQCTHVYIIHSTAARVGNAAAGSREDMGSVAVEVTVESPILVRLGTAALQLDEHRDGLDSFKLDKGTITKQTTRFKNSVLHTGSTIRILFILITNNDL